MPIYEYDCQQCDARIELLVRANDANPTCNHCNSAELSKRISAHAVSTGSPNTPCGNAPMPACGSGGCGKCD